MSEGSSSGRDSLGCSKHATVNTTKATFNQQQKAIINSNNAAVDAVLTRVLRRKATCLGKTTKGAFDGQGEVMKKEASMANARMK